ncbi:MAG: FAD-dependent oxidoreductase [Gammaproteobacteria bacterium]|nr:FAD-dependent oxidoreductase [Gammaproteobacteria bacterium]
MKPTDTDHPNHFHRVVDCQWGCPAHTDVPHYIRQIAQGDYTGAYLENRKSNVFPGVLGRVCDRPCEPACRRGRLDEEPVAICRLKRVAADLADDIRPLLPPKGDANGKRIACIGAGCASLTVANDLLPLGYDIVMFEQHAQPGGLIRTNIPAFRLPAEVLDDEIAQIVERGVDLRLNTRVDSLKELLNDGFDAVFVGTGAPRGKDLDLPGRHDTDRIHIGIDWLESVAFEHTDKIGRDVLIIGVGNTAMDCCRSALRLGGENVKVIARKPRGWFKASDWELEDAEEENVEIIINHAPKAFVIENGVLTGMKFDKLHYEIDADGQLSKPEVIEEVLIPCTDVILAIGQDNAYPWIEEDVGIEMNQWDAPTVDTVTHQSSLTGLFFGGDAAFGPKNIIWAVEHGHRAAISIHKYCQGEDITERPPRGVNLLSTKMGLHEWSYSNDFDETDRLKMRHVDLTQRFKDIKIEVELGFDAEQTAKEVERCLNCDIQTVFAEKLCIECDACMDICPTFCLTITENGEEDDLRNRLRAPADNKEQILYVSDALPQTGKVMVKDENLCIHCGLCAERCPTGAWDMRKSRVNIPYASDQVG